MDTSYEASLLRVADEYAALVDAGGGKSLARVATIVVNRGSFFERLRDGGGCSARNLDKLAEWFRDANNWPEDVITPVARKALASIGRPAPCETSVGEAEPCITRVSSDADTMSAGKIDYTTAEAAQ